MTLVFVSVSLLVKEILGIQKIMGVPGWGLGLVVWGVGFGCGGLFYGYIKLIMISRSIFV